MEAHLIEKAVLLAGVATATAGHHVVPAVCPSSTARNDVIDVLGLCAAVLAPMTVASEDRSTGHSHASLMRNPDVIDQPNDGRFGKPGPSRVKVVTRPVDENRLVGKNENESTSRGDDRQRLERSVQHGRAADHLSLLVVPGETSCGGYYCHNAWRRDARHQSSQATTSSGEGRARLSP